ncbi:hypothetical protein FRC07_011179, partial [Ceratobasidium sp. 392]
HGQPELAKVVRTGRLEIIDPADLPYIPGYPSNPETDSEAEIELSFQSYDGEESLWAGLPKEATDIATLWYNLDEEEKIYWQTLDEENYEADDEDADEYYEDADN